MSSQQSEKERVARAGAELVQDGTIVGLGSGSTAELLVTFLGERVRAGLQFIGIPTSIKTQRLADSVGIPLATLDDYDRLDLSIDGADQVDSRLNLIKGGGGNLLREKIVAAASDRFVVIVDSSKVPEVFGTFPLPVEISPFALRPVTRQLRDLGCEPRLRQAKTGGTYITDENHWILDCSFCAFPGGIDDPAALAATLDRMPGVMDHGLFIGLADQVLIARGDQVETRHSI